MYNVYVDGFNLYKGLLETRPHLKWLDLRRLSECLAPEQRLGTVYFFTSVVLARAISQEGQNRQRLYLRALQSSGVNVVYGKFKVDHVWRDLVSKNHEEAIQPAMPSHSGLAQSLYEASWREAQPFAPKAHVRVPKEKGTDVNLAAYLLRDAYTGACDSAFVLSGDNDFSIAIGFAVASGVTVHVRTPAQRPQVESMKGSSTTTRTIDISLLAECQFPDRIPRSNGMPIERPKSWA